MSAEQVEPKDQLTEESRDWIAALTEALVQIRDQLPPEDRWRTDLWALFFYEVEEDSTKGMWL